MTQILNYISWDPSRFITTWNIPFLDRPVLWYGFFFALGFLFAYMVFQTLLKEFMHPYRIRKKEILKMAEKVTLYVVIGTIIGARLGDVLFYQSPLDYLNDPLGIFKFWEGGLSSHGGVIGILISLWVFCVRYQKKYPMLTWVAMLDLLSIPALLAGGFIRIGNFFNQEIVGTVTTLPWGVIFGHSADGGPLIPRHPVQLYEALFYFVFFIVLWSLRKNVPKMYRLGKTSGLFFIGTFCFRFFVEFVKSPQSALLSKDSALDMGQFLSIPLILVGVLLFFCEKRSLRARSVKGH
ncbi:MAG: Prolipoprotein diacylglyceryl transferase [Chlamydiae bacterium]|nr:Prolipoprotein diacylglyceryl transferase [Chlamydiota bacterium]